MSTQRIRGLDGLRAIAVGLVLVMHKTEFGTSTRVGFYGVWLFFVLSGFLITGQLHAARERIERGGVSVARELLTFWFRRAFRILPAYYAVLAAISLYYLAIGKELHGLIFYVLHLSNFYLSANMEQFHTTWAHFWSLAVEEQFYLLFAPLLLLTPAVHALRICVALVIASVIQRAVMTTSGADSFRIYIDSLVNFGLLASGGILFLVSGALTTWMRRTGTASSIAGWAACASYLVLALISTTVLAGSPALLQLSYMAAGCICLFIVSNVIANQHSSLVRYLERPWIAFAGRLSYAIYLINDYVPADIPMRIVNRLSRGTEPTVALSEMNTWVLAVVGVILSVSITVLCAYLSWLYLEKPALDLRQRLQFGSETSAATAGSFEPPLTGMPVRATET